MRPAAVSPLLLLAACSSDGPGVVLVEGFLDRSPVLACSVAAMPTPPASVVRLRSVGDSLLAVLAQGDREILLLRHDLSAVARLRWAEEGPGALLDPVDVELVGDTLVAVADRGRARLGFLDLQGGARGTLPLGFAPQRILRQGDAWLVSAVPLVPTQAEILYRVADGEIKGVGIAPVHVASPQLKALANTTVLERVGSTRVILAHQFLEPLAHLLDLPPDGGPPVAMRSAGTPLPDGVRDAVGYRPEPPFTDESLRRMLTPVLEAAPDPRSGGMLYLTRTGRQSGGVWEKALVRVDGDMAYVSSWIVPVNVGAFAYLPSADEIVAVAEDERWYRCPLRGEG